MNKKERIRKLTWEYFWTQKLKEITLAILIISILVFVPYFLGNSIGDGRSDSCGDGFSDFKKGYEYDCGLFMTWAEGFIYSIILVLILITLHDWIESNWDKAKERAKKEIGK